MLALTAAGLTAQSAADAGAGNNLEPAATTVVDSVRIHFHVNQTDFDPQLSGNQAIVDSVLVRLRDNGQDSLLTYQGVWITGGASPEGSIKRNEYLSRERANRLFEVLDGMRVLPDSMRHYTFLGRDWNGLLRLVRQDPKVPGRQQVIEVLEKIVKGVKPYSVSPMLYLKDIEGCRAYNYMLKNLFPQLRQSNMRIEYKLVPRIEVVGPEPEPVVDTVMVYVPDPEPEPVIEPIVPMPCSPFYMGLKTNMLYDALLVPNIGVEFYLGKQWSVSANWMYAWWKTDRKHYYWRTYGGDFSVRKWLGSKAQEKPLQGHHLGVYGQMITYDFELGHRGYLAPKWSWAAGVEYGYSLPIARRLNIDFTMGVGYMGGTYKEYIPIDDCYVWQATKKRRWFGPTKLEVSLVWLIGCDNFNRKKDKKGVVVD